jgi:hypothetical protein
MSTITKKTVDKDSNEGGADDQSMMRAAVKSAIDEYIAKVVPGQTHEPPPELLRLLREAVAVIPRNDPREQARLLLLAGLVHDYARDVDGAEQCYAEAERLHPDILRHGVLADVRRMTVRARGRSAILVASKPEPIPATRTLPAKTARRLTDADPGPSRHGEASCVPSTAGASGRRWRRSR